MTMLVQSSSIFTSTLTPLVGIGVVTIERMFPLSLGSNIGTTFTGMLAALVQSQNRFREAMQLALCHLFFNIFGIALFYPIPVMRKLPIYLAKGLGNTTAEYRWFAVFYVISIFFVTPGIIFGLSLAGWQVLVGVGLPAVLVIIFVIIINVLQKKKPQILPVKLKNWEFLPKPLHSLQPYDQGFKIIKENLKKTCKCKHCCKKKGYADENENNQEDINSNGIINPAYLSNSVHSV